jgi:hydrogenase maturation protease
MESREPITKLEEFMREQLERSVKHLIICMGNEIRGDDAVAIKLGIELNELMDNVMIVHNVPGNFTGKIVKYHADLLIFIDAVDIDGLEPGTISQIPRDNIASSGSMTTHYQEFGDFMNIIEHELEHELNVIFLGIQVKDIELMQPLSSEVESSMNKLLAVFKNLNLP